MNGNRPESLISERDGEGAKVKLSLCLTNKTLHHEGVWGNGCIDLHFLDVGTSWR
jgi:hypothetical protein